MTKSVINSTDLIADEKVNQHYIKANYSVSDTQNKNINCSSQKGFLIEDPDANLCIDYLFVLVNYPDNQLFYFGSAKL